MPKFITNLTSGLISLLLSINRNVVVQCRPTLNLNLVLITFNTSKRKAGDKMRYRDPCNKVKVLEEVCSSQT